MKNKNIIKVLKKYSKAIVAVVMVFILTLSAATLSAIASSGVQTDVQVELKTLLGDAKNYGVFAESALIANDFESNIATNNLKVSGTKDIGNTVNTFTNVAGTSFIKNFEYGVLQLRSADNIVVGSAFTKDGDNVTFGTGSGVIKIANAKNVKFFVNPNYVNVTSTLTKIATNFSQFTSTQDNTKGSVVNLSDMNHGIIDISKCTDQVCIVNITMAAYNNLQIGQLEITKNDEQIVIINISGDLAGFTLSRFSVKNPTSTNKISSASDNNIIADTVVFNFSDYSGALNLSEVCGVVVATKANVTVTSTSRGRVMAKTFTNPNGEWHFLAKDLESETETESTTQSESTTQQSTTQAATQPTTQQSTTQAATQPTTQQSTTQAATQPTTQQSTTQAATQPTTQQSTTQAATQPTTQQSTTQVATQVSDIATKTAEVFADEDLVSKTVVIETKAPEVYADEDTVKTGDKNTITVYVIALGISIVIILGFIALDKTKKEKKKKDKNIKENENNI